MKKIILIILLSVFALNYYGCSKEDVIPPMSTDSKYQGSWNFIFIYNGVTVNASGVVASNGSFSSFFVTFPGNPAVTQQVDGFIDDYGRINTGVIKQGTNQVGTFTGAFVYYTGTGNFQTTITSGAISGQWNATKQQ